MRRHVGYNALSPTPENPNPRLTRGHYIIHVAADHFFHTRAGGAPGSHAAAADDAARRCRARLGRRRRGLRHRRRLRRSSQLRHGAAGPACWRPRAFAWPSSASPTGTPATPGGRSAGRGSASPSAPATWTRCSTTTRPTARSATTTPTAPAGRSAGGRTGPRLAYCQRAREAYQGVPIIAGGVEASLRRLAHYDYWSDKVRRSILLDAKADLVVFGMGERPLVEIVAAAGGRRAGPQSCATCAAWPIGWGRAKRRPRRRDTDSIVLPSYEEVVDRQAGLRRDDADRPPARRIPTTPGGWCSITGARRWWSIRRPCRLRRRRWTASTACRSRGGRTRATADERIPAFEVVKDSIQIMRGCFGGCTFCSITAHEGRIIQSRSQESILAEIRRMADEPGLHGHDQRPRRPDGQHVPDELHAGRRSRPKCRRLSCVHPTICKLLGTDHGPLDRADAGGAAAAGREARCLVASGIRMDLALRSPAYMRELAAHHVGGHSEGRPRARRSRGAAADEEAADRGLRGLRPRSSAQASRQAGKKQYLVPYFIAGHPGCDLRRDDRPGRVPQAAPATGPTRCRTSFPARWTSPRACTTRASTR